MYHPVTRTELGEVSTCAQLGAMCAVLGGDGRFETVTGILSSVWHGSGLSAKHHGPEISSLRRSWEEHPRAPGFLSRALDTASVKDSSFPKGERCQSVMFTSVM